MNNDEDELRVRPHPLGENDFIVGTPSSIVTLLMDIAGKWFAFTDTSSENITVQFNIQRSYAITESTCNNTFVS